MTVSESVEIARRPADVFAYLSQLERHGEWQDQIVSVRVEGDGPTTTGTRAVEQRRVGGRTQELTYEITAFDPPRLFSFRGQNGPLRPVGTGRVEPLGDDGARSRLTLDFDLEPHGLLGKLLRPLALRQARKQIPKDQQRLKEKLESGAV